MARLWAAFGLFAERGYHAVSVRDIAAAVGVKDASLTAALDQAADTERDPDGVTDEEASQLLGEEGLPDGANAEVAICLLMCATDAADAGDRFVATELTVRARDLVGEDAAMALIELIRQTDSDGGAYDR